MSEKREWFPCPAIVWMGLTLLGAVIVWLLGGALGFLYALILAVVVAVLLAIYVMPMICSDMRSQDEFVFDGNVPEGPVEDTSARDAFFAGGEVPAAMMEESEATDDAPSGEAATVEEVAEAPADDEPVQEEVADAANESSGVSSKPAAAPEGTTPDDLTRINGIGKVLANGLAENGITTFAQIAAWGPEEIHWADYDLAKFKGRCTRDDWVGQAKELTKG